MKHRDKVVCLGVVAYEAGVTWAKRKETPSTEVDAKSQTQPRVKDLADAMGRYLHDPGTKKPKLSKWLRVNVICTDDQCLSIRSELTNNF